MKQAVDFINDYNHQEGTEVMDIADTFNPEDYYGQVMDDGEKLVSENEWELAKKKAVPRNNEKESNCWNCVRRLASIFYLPDHD